MPELTSHALRIAGENRPNMAVGQAAGQGGSRPDGEDVVEFQCDTNDEKILNATIKAFQSGSLTPLIKEELRCTIQSRRLAEGKGELKVEFKSPPKKKTMTEEERARYLKRRTQNREAAQRFRQKQKDTSDILTAKIQKLERNSRNLLSDLTRLREEKECLKEMLKNHLLVCTNQQHIPSLLSHNELDQLLAESQVRGQENAAAFNSVSMSDSSSPTGSVSTSYFSATPSPRPGTADSSAGGSDVFFPEDNDEGLSYIGANLATEVEVFITPGGDGMANAHYGAGEQLQTLALSPYQDIGIVEEVVIDTNGCAGNIEQQTPEGSEVMRLDSCSSVDTAVDGRGLANSTSSISSYQSSFYGNSSMCSDAPDNCLNNSISMPVFTHDIGMYSEEDEFQKQQEKMTLELAQSLASELSRSHSSDFDISAITDNHASAAVGGVSGSAGRLAESTSDLRHSLAFAHARVHDMCDLELGYTVQDFLLKDAVP